MPKPTIQNMLVCETAEKDQAGSWTLRRIITGIISSDFPAIVEGLWVFFSVRGSLGTTSLVFEIARLPGSLDEPEVFFTSQFPVKIIDPTRVHDQAFKVETIPFPYPGEYRCRLKWENEVLADRVMLVIRQ